MPWARALVRNAALLIASAAALVGCLRRNWPSRREVVAAVSLAGHGLVQVAALLIASAALLGAYVGAAGAYAGIAHTVHSIARTMTLEEALSAKAARLAEFCNTRIQWLEANGPAEPATRSRAYDHLQRTCPTHDAVINSLRETTSG